MMPKVIVIQWKKLYIYEYAIQPIEGYGSKLILKLAQT